MESVVTPPPPAYESISPESLDELVRRTDSVIYDPAATGFSWKLLEDAFAAIPGWFHGDRPGAVFVDEELKHAIPGGYLFVAGGNFLGAPILPLPPTVRRQWSKKFQHGEVWLDKPCFCVVMTEQGRAVIGAY